MYGNIWPCMVIYGNIWYMIYHGNNDIMRP